MNDKVSQAIVDAAEQLGFQAARIWPQIVMVTWITSLFWAILDPILIGAAVYLSIRMVRSTHAVVKQNKADYQAAQAAAGSRYVSSLDYYSMEWVMLCVVIVVVLVCVGGAAATNWPNVLAGAFYPEAVTVLKLAGK
jgi:hypothetical protein